EAVCPFIDHAPLERSVWRPDETVERHRKRVDDFPAHDSLLTLAARCFRSTRTPNRLPGNSKDSRAPSALGHSCSHCWLHTECARVLTSRRGASDIASLMRTTSLTSA